MADIGHRIRVYLLLIDELLAKDFDAAAVKLDDLLVSHGMAPYGVCFTVYPLFATANNCKQGNSPVHSASQRLQAGFGPHRVSPSARLTEDARRISWMPVDAT